MGARSRAEADAAYAAKEWAGALAAYRAELERTPDDAALLDRIAHCEHFLGRYERSLAAWSELASRRARDPIARYNVACANARLGRSDAAFEALESAVVLGFRDGVFENGALTFHSSWTQPDGSAMRRRMSFTDLSAAFTPQPMGASAKASIRPAAFGRAEPFVGPLLLPGVFVRREDSRKQ